MSHSLFAHADLVLESSHPGQRFEYYQQSSFSTEDGHAPASRVCSTGIHTTTVLSCHTIISAIHPKAMFEILPDYPVRNA